MKAARISLCLVPLLCISTGCFNPPPPPDTLNDAADGSLPDGDGDGLFDIAPPASVPFILDETLGASIRSNITFAEARSLSGADVPDFVEAWVTAEVELFVTYEDRSTQTLTGVFPIAPFEFRAEIACPVAVEATASVVANVPFSGRRVIAAFGPIVIDERQFAAEVSCGTTLDVEIALNEATGLVDAVVSTR